MNDIVMFVTFCPIRLLIRKLINHVSTSKVFKMGHVHLQGNLVGRVIGYQQFFYSCVTSSLFVERIIVFVLGQMDIATEYDEDHAYFHCR